MRKEKRKKSIFNKISNRLAYTLIVISIVILLGMGVYAAVGHSFSEISGPSCTGLLKWTGSVWSCMPSPPSCALTNQVLHWDGSDWSCVTIDIGYECYWTGWLTNPNYCYYEDYCGNNCYYPYEDDGLCDENQRYCTNGVITDTREALRCPKPFGQECPPLSGW